MSDSTKFTPGPWETHVSSDFLQVRPVGSNDPICEFGLAPADDWTSEDRIEVQANADITAAAPCMFEALRKIEGGWISDDIDEEDLEATIVEFQKIARAALAKARGETSLAQAEAEDASR
jgi:hypothetical protein